MSDFVCMDWDLQAIVRGCSSEVSTSVMDNPQSCFSPLTVQQDVFLKFPDFCESTTILDELEELYKPFYPQTILTNTSISVPTEVIKPKKMRKQKPVSVSDKDNGNTDQAVQPKYGKNQQKRVVQHVAADGLSSDKWAWRKYGQKPIKGSPYPRSYYRCSSSKGCLARKQVERSSTDPGQFLITYSAEHNHAHPTRRSSLAGSSRNKASMRTAIPSATNEPIDQAQNVLSPITLSVISIEDEFTHQEDIKKEEDRNVFEDGKEEAIPNLSDEYLFSSLKDLEDLLFDQFTDNVSADKTWFFNEYTDVSTQGL